MRMPSSVWRWSDPATAALLVGAAGAVTIAGAWFFEYGLGLAPCPLCLQQRWPYYVAIPLALAVAIGARRGLPATPVRAGLALLALAMLVSAALGAYHAGVEWKWWEGPQDCAAAGGFTGGSAGNLLQRMQTARIVRCDEAAWRDPVLHLSLAGWNVLISLALAGVALSAVFSRKAEADAAHPKVHAQPVR
jgi:disulfide bond formation protein DsbB